ncbi:hypothetical protein TWF106_002116 [Orbilia oligospora]|uniref:Uncharacterized protein n=1 Tax=Orbilia oligospora TaxID=2813651 RepID=A0A6G1M138_ORBOL|nr:hypothetical protein TWF679_010681 [Orbilia oligospora]KAF3225598.1 hypothetical protein TWF106_002116 [Orbilia oligospora]KAF3226195.1 hypothetical protein TWF191_004857 [Orbilia oligospora]KAF3241801.1 hypothetical protein TWF192_008815 [Orbilia oligospora]
MPWSTPTPILLHHRNPPFPSLHIQHSVCQHTTPLTSSQITFLKLPKALTSSRLVLHTVSKCNDCSGKELEEGEYDVEYKTCVNSGSSRGNDQKGKEGGKCEGKVLKGATMRGEGGRCWVCVFRGKVEEFMAGEEYGDMVKLWS